VPVDFCSNLILAATAYTAAGEPGAFHVVHSTTSNQNPAYLAPIIRILTDYLITNPSQKQIFSPHCIPVANEKIYNGLYFLTTDLPLQILEKMSEMPYLGSDKKREEVKTFTRLTSKMKDMQTVFFHFMNQEFIYDNKVSDIILS
jgi:hypothetical protein